MKVYDKNGNLFFEGTFEEYKDRFFSIKCPVCFCKHYVKRKQSNRCDNCGFEWFDTGDIDYNTLFDYEHLEENGTLRKKQMNTDLR